MYRVFICPVVSTTNRPKCLSSGVGVGVAEGAEVEALAEEELWEQRGALLGFQALFFTNWNFPKKGNLTTFHGWIFNFGQFWSILNDF